MFSKMLKEGKHTGELVHLSSSFLLATAVSVAGAGAFFNEEIIQLLYHDTGLRSPAILSTLLASFAFIAVSYVYGTLLTANNSLRQLNILAGMTVVLNIGLNLVLIPQFKAYGAAIASLSSQAFYALCQIAVAHKLSLINVKSGSYINIILFALSTLATAYLLHRFLPWIPALILFVATSIALALITRVIQPLRIIRIFRST
jgi:O-antigen/teichoic acid export membrane protein